MMLKLVKTDGLNLFMGRRRFIKKNVIYPFKFNKIKCDSQPVQFWPALVKNVTKMMLFVS